jgi:hypothetical protein
VIAGTSIGLAMADAAQPGASSSGRNHEDELDGRSLRDPHDIEERTGFAPEELAQGIEGHTGDRFPRGVADEIEAVLRDPLAPVKQTDTGIAIRDERNGRTIMINDSKPWRSTAFEETAGRWNARP